MTYRIQWVDGLDALAQWADDWHALALAAPQRLPMLSPAWIDAFARTRLPPQALFQCVLAEQNGRLLAVLPLVLCRNPPRLLGVAAAATPYDAHTAFGDVLVDPTGAPGLVAAVLQAACEHPRWRMRELALRGVARTSPTLPALDALTQCSTSAVSFRNWGSFLAVAGGWGDYRDGLSKNFRANLRKARNRLRETGVSAPVFIWLTGHAAEPRHLQTFIQLEATGWKGQAGSAIAQDASVRRFYQTLTDNAHRSGALEWHFMVVDGRMIAGHLALRCGRSLSLLKIAYDEQFSHFSPGNLLFEQTAERAFTQGDTDEINCLTDMEWHRPWNMQRREYLDLRLFPKSWVGQSLGRAPRALIMRAKRAAERWPALARLYTQSQGMNSS